MIMENLWFLLPKSPVSPLGGSLWGFHCPQIGGQVLVLNQACSHTHLVVGSESIHVLLEHGCPQISA